MQTDETYQIDVWKGDWGLPSVDIHCLQVLAYAKFNEIPLVVNATNNPFKTPNGKLPCLRYRTETSDSLQNIMTCLSKRKVTSDTSTSLKQSAETLSYGYMLEEKMFPAMQFVWWLDHRNFTELIRPWYAKVIPFPLNFYYPSKYEKCTRVMTELFFPNEEVMSVIESKLYSDAQKCMTALSTRLGERDYFFGVKPELLDALVYSYLAPLLKAPLPNPALQNHLKSCTNLVKFVSRISQRYFENDYQKYEKIKAKENEKGLKSDPENDFPNKRRDQILAGVFATVAMATYAIVSGIVEVSTNDNDDEVVDDTDDYFPEPDVED